MYMANGVGTMQFAKMSFILGVSALALGGCASMNLGDIQPKSAKIETNIERAPLNAQTGKIDWVEPAADRLPDTDWIGGFHDSMLEVLVREAMAANPTVQAAKARLRAAEAVAASSRSGLYPRVGLSSSASRSEAANSRIGGSSSFALGTSVSWEADLWGRVKDTAGASDLEAQASSADFAGSRLAIAAATTQTWFNLIEAKLQRDLAERNVETQRRALRLTKRRFDGGVSGSSDYRLARSALASAEANLAFRKQNQSAITRQLETLLRRYPKNALNINEGLPDLPPLSGAGAPSDVFLRRPDILSAERRLRAQGLRIDIAKKNLLPRLSLSGDINSRGGSLTRLFSLNSLVASLAGNLTQPIFEGGALKADVVRNEAVLAQQLETYADTVLTAYREVENALDAESLLAERERALAVSLEESRKAEERLEQRFSEGLASILQLLDSQTRRINAEGALITAKKERLANRVRLYVALGGGLYGQESERQKLPKPKLTLPKLAELRK